MKLTKLLFPLFTFIVIITSCGKDDLPTVDGGLTAKPSMLAKVDKPADDPGTGGTTTTTNGSDKTKLAVPVVTAAVTGTTVVVSWNEIPNANGYHVVFGDVDSTANSIPSQKTGLVTSLTVSNVQGGNFKVKVRALAPNGNDVAFIDGPFSGVTTFTVISIPAVVPPFVPPTEAPKAQLATPVVSASDVSYRLGNGNTSVSWPSVTNATSYSVTLNGTPLSHNTSPISLNLAPGTYTVAVTAKATGYPTSEEGLATIFVKARKPITTPVISGTVSYTAASAGTVSVTPLFIWPPNNKLTTVTFVGTGLSTGTGSYSATHNGDVKATDYDYDASPLTQSNLAPGSYTVTVKAIAGDTYDDDNWVNSAVGSSTFVVAPGSLKAKLIDEYGVYTNPNITLTPSFTLSYQLMASRLGTDKTGRDYTFTITATNGGGVPVSSSAVSNVPHDQR